jgi:hypothetical protein
LIIAVLAGLLVWSAYSNLLSKVETTLADGHAGELEMLRDDALLNTNVTKIADTLRYMAIYYAPSDPEVLKKRHESLLRRVRRELIRDVIDHLRSLTGRDLGDDPAPWVAAYAPPER